MEHDERFMKRCLELASIAKTRGKTAVGSIIVRGGEIIAEGIESDPGYPALVAHAEIVALIKATEILGTKDLSDCTMYSTVEPCLMCSYITRETRIQEVVFGVSAGQIGGSNPDLPVLTTGKMERWPNPVKIRGGVMERECREVLRK